jgi:hypothetical protein
MTSETANAMPAANVAWPVRTRDPIQQLPAQQGRLTEELIEPAYEFPHARHPDFLLFSCTGPSAS